MDLTDEQRRLQESAIAFARQALNYDVVSADAARRSTARRGATARSSVSWACRSQAVRRAGTRSAALLAVMEGLATAPGIKGLLFSLNAHLWTDSIPFWCYGSQEQRKPVSAGPLRRQLIGANGASEPEAGSDIFSMRPAPSARRPAGCSTAEDLVTSARWRICSSATRRPTRARGDGPHGFIVQRGRPASASSQDPQDGRPHVPMGRAGPRIAGSPPTPGSAAKGGAPRSSTARWSGSGGHPGRRLGHARQLERLHRVTPAAASSSASRSARSSRSPTRSST